MIVYKISCPHCGQHYTCQDSHAHQTITCTSCKKTLIVPAAPLPNHATVVHPPSGHTWDTFAPPKQPDPRYGVVIPGTVKPKTKL